MKKQFLMVLLAVTSIFLLSGCGSKNIEVKIPESQIMADKEKSYIVFSRPSVFMGGGLDIDVMEIDIKRKEPIKLVGIISNGEKMIYETEEGIHHFFSNVGQNENIERIEIKKGETKYVNLAINTNLMMGFYPLEIKQSRIKLLDKLANYPCNESTRKKFLFDEELDMEGNPTNFYTSPLHFKIKCNNDKIISIKDLYHDYTIDELNEATLVQSTKSATDSYDSDLVEFAENIKEYYTIWDFKFRNVPIVEVPIMLIDDIIDEQYLNTYKSIEIISGKHNEKMDQKLINEYIEDLKNDLKDFNTGDNKLIVRITFDKYDNGNMAARYLLTGIGKNSLRESMGVIDFKVELINKDNEVFNSFRMFEVEAGGFLGGINTLKSDTMNIMKKYITNNLLVETKQ